MLGFTLSKLNLLILVTALFAIISFFLFSLDALIVSFLAQQMVDEYKVAVHGVVTGDLACRNTAVTVPESIQYFGGLAPSKRFYYRLSVKRYPPDFQPDALNSVIFQISSRKDPDKIMGASSIDVNARIYLYDWDSENDILTEKDAIDLDPVSGGIATKNSLLLRKETYEGQAYLHLIACSSSVGICELNEQWAACWISKCADNPRESSCFPKPEDCSDVSCGG